MILTTEEQQALVLSLRVSLVAVAASLPAAVALGWLLARRRFAGRMILDGLLNLPLVMPPVVTGFLLLVLFGRNGWIGGPLDRWFGLSFAFRWQGASLAAAVVSFPLFVRAIRISMEAVDPRLEQAARTLGASPVRVFREITLPLALPGLLAGAVLAFARSMGEFGATITFVGNIAGETRTLPLAVHSLLERPGGEPGAWRLLIISVAVSFAALMSHEAVARWTARRIRAASDAS